MIISINGNSGVLGSIHLSNSANGEKTKVRRLDLPVNFFLRGLNSEILFSHISQLDTTSHKPNRLCMFMTNEKILRIFKTKLQKNWFAFSGNFHKRNNSAEIHVHSFSSQFEPIWTNLKSEILRFFFRQQSEMDLKEIWGQSKIWEFNLKSEESIWTNLNQSKIWSFYNSSRQPVWNESESNTKPIWNMKSQSETELEVKVILTKSETELEGKFNWKQSETELEGAFHCGNSSPRFHPHSLLLGWPPIGLKLLLIIDPHRFPPGLLFGANPNGLLQKSSFFLHRGPLNPRQSFRLHPHCLDSFRLSFACTVLSF